MPLYVAEFRYCRLHLCVDSGRLALRGRRHRSVLTPCGRLVDECQDDGTTRHRCPTSSRH
jgi:hypothetical protein